MGGVVLVIIISVIQQNKTSGAVAESFPGHNGGALLPAGKTGLVRRQRRQWRPSLKAIGAIILLALGGTAFAQASGTTKDKAPGADRPLLATFCDAADIKGSACRRAKGYRSGKRCDVKLTPDRHSGKFLTDGSTLLIVNYESGCEPHATNFGGAVIFNRRTAPSASGDISPPSRPMIASRLRGMGGRTG
jgi:hypothetical protein